MMLAHISEQLVDETAHERARRVNAGNQLGNHLQATHIIHGLITFAAGPNKEKGWGRCQI